MLIKKQGFPNSFYNLPYRKFNKVTAFLKHLRLFFALHLNSRTSSKSFKVLKSTKIFKSHPPFAVSLFPRNLLKSPPFGTPALNSSEIWYFQQNMVVLFKYKKKAIWLFSGCKNFLHIIIELTKCN